VDSGTGEADARCDLRQAQALLGMVGQLAKDASSALDHLHARFALDA